MAKTKTMDLPIEGMHCASCAVSIEKSLNNVEGIDEASVDLNSEKAHVVMDSKKVSIDDIDKTVSGLGYKVRTDEVKLRTHGMHCASCVLTIEKGLMRMDGVFKVHADLTTGIVTVEYDHNQISVDEMGKAIEDFGFEYLGLEGDLNEHDEEEIYENDLKEKRNRIVVGLIFSGLLMYIMYAHVMVPYLTMGELSLVISIIPFVYVAYPIVKAGLTGVFHKSLNMDVMYTMGILVAYGSSVLGTFGILLDSSFMLYDTALMLPAFLMIGRYLEAKAKRRTSSSIKSLIGLQPKTAIKVTIDEKGNTLSEEEIPIENIQIDDILLVKPGEKVPADSEVVVGKSYVDESMINGEPVPKLKEKGEDVFAGTINQDGIIKIQAKKIGKDTLLSQIIELVERAQSSKPPVQGFADRVVSVFIPVIITIALVVFALWYFVLGSTLLFALTTMISILVVACPCALGLATPTAVTVGVGRAAEYGILIKNGETLETSEKVNVAVFDKTGTITQGKPEVVDVVTLNDSDVDVLSYVTSIEKNSNHPIANAIVDYGTEKNTNVLDVEDFENVTGKGLKGFINDEEVLVGNKALLEANGVEISSDNLEEFDKFVSEAKTAVFLAVNKKVSGILTLMDKIKDNSANAISQLHDMDIDTYMVTGDNGKTAHVVADKVGIDHVVSDVLPNEKLDKVEELQKDNEKGKVLFVGDGINDAPAITGADIGIALGEGTDVAMESGDIVLMEGDLENVVASVQISKKVMTRIKENIFWAFAYNAILIPLAAGVLYPAYGILFRPEFSALAMALSSVTVISLSLLLKSYVPPVKKASQN
ncbi:MAG: heavy metal translocating P-type ATPase [Methanobrevibacter boviskoreani]|jgi:Cu+-exporting ATPase|uniref:heavy metal translocating P-type ATPase n=1 Tax=Methanobrevibacter boviskoreani TaxID=1348249 RepID=UPI003D8BB8C8